MHPENGSARRISNCHADVNDIDHPAKELRKKSPHNLRGAGQSIQGEWETGFILSNRCYGVMTNAVALVRAIICRSNWENNMAIYTHPLEKVKVFPTP
jgi:hypothetical protein